jgi:hypothetical protein
MKPLLPVCPCLCRDITYSVTFPIHPVLTRLRHGRTRTSWPPPRHGIPREAFKALPLERTGRSRSTAGCFLPRRLWACAFARGLGGLDRPNARRYLRTKTAARTRIHIAQAHHCRWGNHGLAAQFSA